MVAVAGRGVALETSAMAVGCVVGAPAQPANNVKHKHRLNSERRLSERRFMVNLLVDCKLFFTIGFNLQ
jgi:hypothetical protein